MKNFFDDVLTAGFSLESFPGFVHHLLRLLNILFLKVAETALKFQILLDGNDLGFFLEGVGPSILDFVKREDP